MSNKLTVIILSFNEELNIAKCLRSLTSLNANVVVLDSFSTDSTEKIAKEFGATFYQNKFSTHVLQWKHALENLSLDLDWVLGIDADQELTPALVKELNELIHSDTIPHNGYYVPRKNYFLNKWIRFGGYYPVFLLKLFKKETVYLDTHELMDHHFYINGSTGKLKNDLIENNLKEDLSFWTAKHLKYAQLQANEEFENRLQTNGNLFGNKDERRIFLKRLWNRLPLFIRPLLYFFYRYILLLGFLDGKRGLVFHFMQAFWYRMLIDGLLYELKFKKKLYDKETER